MPSTRTLLASLLLPIATLVLASNSAAEEEALAHDASALRQMAWSENSATYLALASLMTNGAYVDVQDSESSPECGVRSFSLKKHFLSLLAEAGVPIRADRDGQQLIAAIEARPTPGHPSYCAYRIEVSSLTRFSGGLPDTLEALPSHLRSELTHRTTLDKNLFYAPVDSAHITLMTSLNAATRTLFVQLAFQKDFVEQVAPNHYDQYQSVSSKTD